MDYFTGGWEGSVVNIHSTESVGLAIAGDLHFIFMTNGRGTKMLTEYIQAAMRQALYELLEDDGTFYGSIPECIGVWANEETLEDCRTELQSVLEDWMLSRMSDRLALPVIDGIDLNPQQQEVA